jgi:cytoskeletal protein CcmA (bactofilin family)
MFERGKREDAPNQGAEARPAETYRSSEPASAKPAENRRGECAVIGRSIQIEGAVRGNEDLRIEGDVSGTVEFRDSSLTIGKEGKVRADVYAKSIIVDGMTEGDLYATDRVIVHVNAQVRGNITAPNVGVEEGAKFKGSIEMDQAAVEKAFNKANLQTEKPPAADRQPAKNAEFKPAPKPNYKDKDKGADPAVGPAAGVN